MSTILLVDEMVILRDAIAMALRNRGHDVLGVADAAAALAILRERRADLIVLDIAASRMDGMRLLEAIRTGSHHTQAPVLVLTTLADAKYIVRAAKLGVKGYLLKRQTALADLTARIETLVGGQGDQPPASAGVDPTHTADAGGGAADDSLREQAHGQDFRGQVPGQNFRGQAPASASPATETAARSASLRINEAAEHLRDLKPILRRSEIDQRMDSFGELKAMSPTVTQVLRMTGSADCSIDRVAKVVKQDQAIALKVLRMANSVVYTRGEPVESVPKAVMRIGLSQVRQLVLNISVIDRFSESAVDEQFHSDAFWEHSIATGLIAASLARGRGGRDSEIDAAFTMGLLHDVGRMVYAEQMPEHYGEVLRVAEKLKLPLEWVESRLLLVNHADLMDKVLHAWKFPKQLIDPVALHHLSISNARNLARSTVTEVATLGLANRLAHALLLGSSGNETIYPTQQFVEALKLRPDDVHEIERVIPDQTDDVKFAMLRDSTGRAWPRMLDRVREALTGPVRPLFIGAEPACDAYRILFDRIRSTDDSVEPNLAVAHLTHVRERVTLSELLERAEAEAEAAKLPLLVLSSKANIELEERTMKGRRFRMLPSTVSLWRLVDAVNELIAGRPAPADPRPPADAASQTAAATTP